MWHLAFSDLGQLYSVCILHHGTALEVWVGPRSQTISSSVAKVGIFLIKKSLRTVPASVTFRTGFDQIS